MYIVYSSEHVNVVPSHAVSGEANFAMSHTGLTLGGFIQPTIARNLIEIQSNVEKGLCQRFLWVVPQPTVVSFEKLQRVNKEFTTSIGKVSFLLGLNVQCNHVMLVTVFHPGIGAYAVGLMTALWIPDHTIHKWILPRPCATFSNKYDKVQEQIMQISCMDDLLSGEC